MLWSNHYTESCNGCSFTIESKINVTCGANVDFVFDPV